jgi:hypothetical protein
MDWRSWLYDVLSSNGGITALVGDRIYSQLETPPEQKPFLVFRITGDVVDVGPLTDVTVWVHDQPGSYVRIDQILALVRNVLEGPVPESGAIAAQWTGNSGDLADPDRRTVMRYSTFRLVAA